MTETSLHLCSAIEDAVCIGGALGLGVSLFLIHIYVTPLKRFLQVETHGKSVDACSGFFFVWLLVDLPTFDSMVCFGTMGSCLPCTADRHTACTDLLLSACRCSGVLAWQEAPTFCSPR